MDGYSVTEAASVLGVPTERVWELLARGVLAGAPEGESGMRVFLQPRPARVPTIDASTAGDGGAREPERELSPFRELLTEFRNLTERYGQALLALGESRGEVAALRSRVDMLEARIDLRLPSGAAAPTPWVATPVPEPEAHSAMPTLTPEPVEPEPVQPVADEAPQPPAEAEPEARAEPALEPFADADERVAESVAIEAAPPPVEPEVRVPDITAAEVETPDGATEGDEAESDEPRPHPRGPRWATESFAEALARAEDPTAAELPAPTAEPDASAAEAVLPESLPIDEPVPVAEEPSPQVAATEAESVDADIAGMDEPSAGRAFAEEEHEAEASVEPIGGEAFEVGAEAPAEPLEWDAGRYTTVIDEPDWLEAEVDEAPFVQPSAPEPGIDEPADAASPEGLAAPPAPDEQAVEADAEEPAEAEEPTETAEPDQPSEPNEPSEPSEPAEHDWPGPARASAAEPEAVIATPPTAPREPSARLPGSAELDAALDELRRSVTGGSSWQRSAQRGDGPSQRPGGPALPSATPAGRAYRRLRRIFPG